MASTNPDEPVPSRLSTSRHDPVETLRSMTGITTVLEQPIPTKPENVKPPTEYSVSRRNPVPFRQDPIVILKGHSSTAVPTVELCPRTQKDATLPFAGREFRFKKVDVTTMALPKCEPVAALPITEPVGGTAKHEKVPTSKVSDRLKSVPVNDHIVPHVNPPITVTITVGSSNSSEGDDNEPPHDHQCQPHPRHNQRPSKLQYSDGPTSLHGASLKTPYQSLSTHDSDEKSIDQVPLGGFTEYERPLLTSPGVNVTSPCHELQRTKSMTASVGEGSTSQYLKDQIVSFFQVSDNKLAMKLFGNKNALLKEKLRQKSAGHWVIHPLSNFR